jgi:hypothetical protein
LNGTFSISSTVEPPPLNQQQQQQLKTREIESQQKSSKNTAF